MYGNKYIYIYIIIIYIINYQNPHQMQLIIHLLIFYILPLINEFNQHFFYFSHTIILYNL